MNGFKRPRTNKAKNDKSSILADAKNMLYVLYGCLQRMPKIERIEGAPMEMKRAAAGIVSAFTVAKECPEVRSGPLHLHRKQLHQPAEEPHRLPQAAYFTRQDRRRLVDVVDVGRTAALRGE